MTDTDELPQLLDEEPRGKLEVARELVDIALEEAPDDTKPVRATKFVALAAIERGEYVPDGAWELARKTTAKSLSDYASGY